MQVNDNGTVTLNVSELVMIKGTVKATRADGTPNKNAGKPFTMVKIDNQRSFDVNEMQSETLQRLGIRVQQSTGQNVA